MTWNDSALKRSWRSVSRFSPARLWSLPLAETHKVLNPMLTGELRFASEVGFESAFQSKAHDITTPTCSNNRDPTN